MMRVVAVVSILLLALLAGCVTVEDKNQTDPPDDGSGEEPEPEPEPVADDSDELKGGDPDDDTIYQEDVGVPGGATWKKADHRFRIPFKVSSTTDVGTEVRFTIDVGEALNEVGLRWVHPGVPLREFDPDASSVVVQQVSSAGIVQQTVSVEARAAGTHAIEFAFEHVGGAYIVYFDEQRNAEDGEQHALFPNAEHTLVRRGDAQWQGDDLWGLTYTSGSVNFWPGSQVNLYATIQSDTRDANGRTALEFRLEPRAPSDWEDVGTDPADPAEVSGSQRRVGMSGISPEDASGSDTVHLDVVSGGDTVTATFLVKYHQV